MIAILVVAAGVSAITAMRWAIQGKEVTVPVLTGKTEAEAATILEDEQAAAPGFQQQAIQQGCSGRRIVDQNPPAGTHLKTSRSVKVLLSAGDRSYAVPNLVGIESSCCKADPRAAQFHAGQHVDDSNGVRRASDNTAAGSAAGFSGRDGSTVNVLVSSGRSKNPLSCRIWWASVWIRSHRRDSCGGIPAGQAELSEVIRRRSGGYRSAATPGWASHVEE